MSNSKMISGTILTKNYSSRNGYKVTKITPHVMAAKWTAKQCGEYFKNSTTQASSNYGIGVNGEIYLYVDEANRSWCSSSRDNDQVAVTIEIANTVVSEPYNISDASYVSLIQLMTDICRRNGIERMNYTGNKSGNLTAHRWFANKSCPGNYVYSRLGQIAKEVNYRLEHKIIDKGCVEDLVLEAQKLLVSKGYSLGGYEPDGNFGNCTHAAVIAFQKDNGIETDGIIGDKTWAALKAESKDESNDEDEKKEEEAEPSQNVLYRVQCGAFSKIESAEALKKKLQADGYDAFIKAENV